MAATILATETAEVKLKSIQELHPILMNASEVVVLDIETTGFSPKKFSEIIEIGAVRLNLDSKKVSGKFSQLIQPSNAFTIPQHISELTTITWQSVEDKPFIEEVLPDFYAFLGDTPIVAHNALFDWPRFLVPAFRSVGLIATNEAICSMRLAKHLYPGRGASGYGLEPLCRMFGHEMIGHHQAWQDCLWTSSLFCRMITEYRDRYQATMPSDSLFQTPILLNPLPSAVGFADLSAMRVNRVSFDEGMSKRHGPRIYVSTNFGRLCYSVRRRMWTVVELWGEKNIPVQEWGAQVLKVLRMDADTFVRTYRK